MTEPTPAYGWHTLRSLHSAWIDWMTRAPAEVRDPVLAAFGGLSFPHWLLATQRRRCGSITTRIDADRGCLVGYLVHTSQGDIVIVEMPSRFVGMTDQQVIDANLHAMQVELEELIDEQA
jgi:hypothetical protein